MHGSSATQQILRHIAAMITAGGRRRQCDAPPATRQSQHQALVVLQGARRINGRLPKRAGKVPASPAAAAATPPVAAVVPVPSAFCWAVGIVMCVTIPAAQRPGARCGYGLSQKAITAGCCGTTAPCQQGQQLVKPSGGLHCRQTSATSSQDAALMHCCQRAAAAAPSPHVLLAAGQQRSSLICTTSIVTWN